MKIITTVGTSLIEKYKKEKDDIFSDIVEEDYFTNFQNSDYMDECQRIIKELNDFFDKEEQSAETTTIQKITEKYRDEKYFEVHLIATDTLLSYVVAEAIKKFYEGNKNIKVYFDRKKDVIEKLMVSNSSEIVKKGYKNLIKKLLDLTTGYNEIYNISGGYKALVPIMTLIASYKKINLAYIYENEDNLIKIPPFPFEIKKDIINKLSKIFDEIDTNSEIEKNKFYNLIGGLSNEDKRILEFIFEEEEDNKIITSTIGDILLEDYLESKEIELIKCSKQEKNEKVDGGRHHDKEIVKAFGKKLIQNHYVCKILGSAEYETKKKNFVLEVEPQGQKGIIKIKIPNEEKATILIQTSGRNQKETTKIAQILEEKFN